MFLEVTRNSEGNVIGYNEKEYDEKGNMTCEITHDSDGNIVYYDENYNEKTYAYSCRAENYYVVAYAKTQ